MRNILPMKLVPICSCSMTIKLQLQQRTRLVVVQAWLSSILLLWKCVAEPNISSFQCLVFHSQKLKLISGVLEGYDQLAGDPTMRNFGYMYISWSTLVLHTPSEQSCVWIVLVCKSLPCHFAWKTLVTKLKSMLQWKQVSCFHWMFAFLPNETLPCSPIAIIVVVL